MILNHGHCRIGAFILYFHVDNITQKVYVCNSYVHLCVIFFLLAITHLFLSIWRTSELPTDDMSAGASFFCRIKTLLDGHTPTTPFDRSTFLNTVRYSCFARLYSLLYSLRGKDALFRYPVFSFSFAPHSIFLVTTRTVSVKNVQSVMF